MQNTQISFRCLYRLRSVDRESGKWIPSEYSVRNLGVLLDQTLYIQQHISSVCRTAYLELKISSIRPYLTQSATAQFVSSAISA